MSERCVPAVSPTAQTSTITSTNLYLSFLRTRPSPLSTWRSSLNPDILYRDRGCSCALSFVKLHSPVPRLSSK